MGTVFDNFNRAGGVLAAPDWSQPNAGLAVNATQQLQQYSGFGVARWISASFGDSQFAQATIIAFGSLGSDSCCPAVRVTADYACYFIGYGAGPIYSFGHYDGVTTITPIGSTFGIPALNDVVRLEVTGQGTGNIILKAYVNGSPLSTYTITGADPVVNSGAPGLFGYGTASAPILDDWSGGDIGDQITIQGNFRLS